MKTQNNNDSTRKWGTLLIVTSLTFMATLDSSIVNLLLPVMSMKLNVSTSSIEWVVASYSIIICSTILFFGRLGDMIGKAKIFRFGCIIFVIGSLLCGISNSFTSLIIFRFIQGIGGSAYMANNHGIITEMFRPKERGKALGILTTSVALGTMIGPPLGGIIASTADWHFAFLINVPIGIIFLILGIKYLPKGVIGQFNLDISGSLLQFLGISLFFGSFIFAQNSGFTKPIICTILVAILLLIICFRTEKNAKNPLLDFTIFSNKLFSINLLCAFIAFTCIAASTILLPFYFQYTLKLDSSIAGFCMIVSPIVLAIFSTVCGTISDKIGSLKMCFAGFLIMCMAFLFLSFANETTWLFKIISFMGLMSLGQAVFQPANNTLVMSNCPKEKLGIAGSINSLVRNLGQIAGITISTTVLYAFMGHKYGLKVTGYILGQDDVFLYGMTHVYRLLALFCLIGLIINFFLIKREHIK